MRRNIKYYCAKIALLVITHTIASVNLLSSPKASGLQLCTQRKQRLPSVTFPIELNVTLGHAHILKQEAKLSLG